MAESLPDVSEDREVRPFGLWHRDALRPASHRKTTTVPGSEIQRTENDQNGILDSVQSFLRDHSESNYKETAAVITIARGTRQFKRSFDSIMDNYENIVEGKELNVKTEMLSLLSLGLNQEDSAPENVEFSKKIVDTIYRLTVLQRDIVKNKDQEETIKSLLGGPRLMGFKDMRYLIYRGIVAYQDEVKGKYVAGYMMARFGVGLVLSNIRQVVNDDSLNETERNAAKRWAQSFWEGITPIAAGKLNKNWDDFYQEVDEATHPMTEATEGDKRVAMLLQILPELGIGQKDLILDVACGDGWLTQRLADQLYKVIGIEQNDRFFQKALERANGKVIQGDFFELRRQLQRRRLKPKAEIINGRTMMHLKKMSDTWEFDSPVVIFDTADPRTGGAATRIEKFREKLEQYGFNKEWLKENSWNILGTIDKGEHLGDRFAPPEEWWKWAFEERGYKVKVVREENYDGQGTDNLVFICQQMEDGPERDTLISEAHRNAGRRRDDRAKNSNKFYTSGYYAVSGY